MSDATSSYLNTGTPLGREIDRLRTALRDLLSWFGEPDGRGLATLPHGLPSAGVVKAARAALNGEEV